MLRSSILRRGLAPVLAIAAIVVFVAGCAGGTDGITTQGPSGGGEAQFDADSRAAIEQPADAAAALPGGAEGGAGPDGGGLPLPQAIDRKIVRTATLALEVEDVSAAVQRVETVAVAAGGFVSESTVFVSKPPEPENGSGEAPEWTQTATVTIRVPAEAYSNVMSQLRGIAEEVTSETSQASEVTEEYTDLEARLRNLKATEAQYLTLLEKAESITDILTVQDRINSVRLEIEQVQGRMNLLDNLTDLATITVSLTPPGTPVEGADSGKGWAKEAWDSAWEGSQDALQALGTVAIVGGVALVWLAVPALVAAAAWRWFGWKLLGARRPRGEETEEGGAST